VSRLPVPDAKGGTYHQMPALTTNAEYADYIASRTKAWLASRKTAAAANPHG
jgi:phospholipase C